MPLVEEKIDNLKGAKAFSLIDLTNGFFHVPVAEDSIKYTSFITPSQFEFMMTSFGLCNSLASILRFIDEVFQELIQQEIVVTYMDDIVVSECSYEDGYEKLIKVFKIAEERGLNINWNKSHFLKTKIEFLGVMKWKVDMSIQLKRRLKLFNLFRNQRQNDM